jgi:23S rRNA pseudouridine1911/1915/1917 synthase
MKISPDDSRVVVQCTPLTTSDLFLQCRLGEGDGGRPLLELLTASFPYHPASRWRELIEMGQVTVNGQAATSGQMLAAGDRLGYLAAGFTEPEVPTCFEPVMETVDLRLVGKPAGTPVARTGLIVRNTLVNLLNCHYGEDTHPLHRLDRETSGLILCARNREACQRWQNPRQPLIVGKYYLAVVRGRMPLGTRQSEQALAVRPESEVRCRMWPEAAGKPCRTIFHTLAAEATASLVLAELVTGRRHQIRAHLAQLGYPVIGDKIYSHGGHYFLKRVTGELTADDFRELGANNHTLHAWAMRLKPPGEPERLFFSRIFSEDLRRYLIFFPGWEKNARERLAQICSKPANW